MRKFLVFSLFLIVLTAGCAGSSIFQELGDNIAAPNGLVIDTTTNRFYVINANTNVLYNWLEGSVQIYDITDPLGLSLLNTLPTESFSGEAFLDTTRKLLYTTNRFSEENNITEDHLFIINVDEASADFLSLQSIIVGANPYGLYCCYPPDRMWIATEANDIEYMNLADNTVGGASLLTDLSEGGSFTASETTYIAVLGNQAFLNRIRAGMIVVNLDEVDDTSKNPVDYWVEDIMVPGDVKTDGTYVYMTDEENIDGDLTPLLLVMDPSKMPPLTDNATTIVLDKEDDGILVAQITVCDQPQRIHLTTAYAFVTCKNGDDEGQVAVVDLATRTVVTTLTVGDQPFNMVLYAPGGVEKYLYVGNIESNDFSIIDIATLTVIGVYPL